LDDIKQL